MAEYRMKNLYPAILYVLVMFSALMRIQARNFSGITGNNTGSNQAIFNNTIPNSLTGTIPGSGIGTYTYQGLLNSTSAVAGFTNTYTANGTGYAPDTLIATRWYRRIVTSGIELDTTSAVQITVTLIITAAFNTVTVNQNICHNTVPAILALKNFISA